MRPPSDASSAGAAGPFDRLLGPFSDVRPGEGARAAAMLLNIFLIMACSYLMKTVREPLILADTVPDWMKGLGVTGPAQVKTYSAAGQAVILMLFVPAYSWFASRLDRMKLILGVTAFFLAAILVFGLALQSGARHTGVFFYVWFGLFNMSVVAQFWSYANDLYTKDAGHRLFPIIGVGMTAGPPVGAWIAHRMFDAHLQPHVMLYLAAALLLATTAFYAATNRGRSGSRQAAAARAPIGGKGAFALVLASRYIGLIVALLVLLNIVNTVGEYILSDLVVAHAAEAVRTNPAFDKNWYIGTFYGSYYFWVNVTAVVLQTLVAPRLVKRFGMSGVLFALPFIALGVYGFVALGATMAVVRWGKTAENSTDYSIMNTAKGLLWLPTTREEKYKAKQAVDSFFVRMGDLVAAFVVLVGTGWLMLGARGLSLFNVAFAAVWVGVALLLVRENHRLSAAGPVEGAGA